MKITFAPVAFPAILFLSISLKCSGATPPNKNLDAGNKRELGWVMEEFEFFEKISGSMSTFYTFHPTDSPTQHPTRHPTRHPTHHPTHHPTEAPLESKPDLVGSKPDLVGYMAPMKTKELLTTLDGGNEGKGAMFKIEAVQDLEIVGFAPVTKSTSSVDVKVWELAGDYIGFETDAKVWNLIQEETVMGMGEGTLTPVPNLAKSISVSAGATHSFYVAFADGQSPNLLYSSGKNEGDVYAENSGEIKFFEGVGKSAEFGFTFRPRIWNGAIFYDLASAPAPVAAPKAGKAPHGAAPKAGKAPHSSGKKSKEGSAPYYAPAAYYSKKSKEGSAPYYAPAAAPYSSGKKSKEGAAPKAGKAPHSSGKKSKEGSAPYDAPAAYYSKKSKEGSAPYYAPATNYSKKKLIEGSAHGYAADVPGVAKKSKEGSAPHYAPAAAPYSSGKKSKEDAAPKAGKAPHSSGKKSEEGSAPYYAPAAAPYWSGKKSKEGSAPFATPYLKKSKDGSAPYYAPVEAPYWSKGSKKSGKQYGSFYY